MGDVIKQAIEGIGNIARDMAGKEPEPIILVVEEKTDDDYLKDFLLDLEKKKKRSEKVDG